MSGITQNNLAEYENVSPPSTQKSNFLYSFSLLPNDEKTAINSLYAFCSYIDYIVDHTENYDDATKLRKLERLDWWEKEIDKLYSDNNDKKLIKRLSDIFQKFEIPKQYFLTLIDGCRKDIYQNRYNTFEELKEYCYSVASIVGLMSIEIFGYKHEETKSYATNLGYALQLTNILRDIKHDKDRGYIYIPKEDLKKFKYSEEDLINEVYNDNFINLMRFQVDRAKSYYFKARTMLRPDERKNMFPAEIMDEIYFRLLEKIELNNYNIFKKKIKVSNLHKLIFVLKHWLSVKLFISRFTL